MKNRYGEQLFCELADRTICALPAWMFDPECAKFSIGSPLVCADAMRELRDVLSTWQAAHDWDKASQEQSPREVVRESTGEAVAPAVTPAARRCPQGTDTRRKTKRTSHGSDGAVDPGRAGKRRGHGKRRRR